ncbi:type 1 glutamine amidotransferase [Rhodoplanes sp. Z2-YC6860]|uniref:type 1 glutamine amidotransferase n=1 Tax=Rhodoplanes sp. Z2-YC6860 TaxID=674703 RepID=UPI00078D2F3F|nr:type 1 glutamine amidotransferase [Rhodoplanes sp. Z2-YC6860]AMN44595.1 glutamine amidotransferase [Rhodoplanes sp. Z2-YC6860]
MPAPRLLVMEGNSPETRAQHVAAGGTVASTGYANLLQELLPSAVVDICFPGDPGSNLPIGEALEGYDGVAITGSGLHVYDGGPEVTRQIELARSILEAGTPIFGSCWGLQVLTTAAGGIVRKNPKGREIGFGRGIRLTEPGRKHPMYVGKPEVFNAPTVHLDEVETVAPGMTVLATNQVSDVQSAEIKYNGTTAWGVQYHPEYPLREVATIVRRIGPRLIDEGFFLNTADIETFASDLDTLDRNPSDKRLSWRHGISRNVLEKKLRTGEVANWLEFQVLPTRAKRGRG